jgi:hypothetical protein
MNPKIKAIKAIIEKFANLNGAQFVGIKAYRSSTTNELANHVVIANFSYYNAVQKDLKALKEATNEDIKVIATSNNFSIELVKQAIEKLTESFENNLNPETKSNQSKAQTESYEPINECMKLHIETGKIFIYALTVPESKVILEAGEYKEVKSRDLTLAQNAVKKYFKFSTAKFRQFAVNADQLSGVNIDGDKISIL